MADNNIENQVKGFLGKLGMPQKIILFGAPVVIIGLLMYFFSGINTKEQAVLFTGLEQVDAGKIAEYLKTNKIAFKLDESGSTITVDKDIVMETRVALASQGMPESSVVGYELFDKTNLGMSEFVQKLNYRRALEGELVRTINSIEEVKKSRVHIVIPDAALFQKDQKKPTASVTLQLKSGRMLSQKTVEGIQTLVASSVEGMEVKNVSVIDHKGKILSVPEVDITTAAGLTSQQYEQQKNVENYLTEKAQSMLDNVLGFGNANVRLNAELDFTKIEQTKTDYDPERQVARSEQTIQESNKSSDTTTYNAVNSERNQANSIINYEISQNVEVISHSVGNIKRLSVSAIINNVPKVIDSAGMKVVAYTPRSEEEIQKLTELIKNAVGYNPERNDQISVTNVQFDTLLDTFEIESHQKLEWYNEPYYQKLMLLFVIIIITIFLMYKFMQSKIIRERVRIAMELPGKPELSVDLDTETQQQQMVDELNFDDNLLLLPSELPEQLLLSGDSRSRGESGGVGNMNDGFLLESENYPEKGVLRGKKGLSYNAELDEENMMKIELRNKVQDYMENNAEEAARLVRILINQDSDERKKL